MTNQERLHVVAKADAVAGLLNHLGWTEVIVPALKKTRELYTNILVSAVLSNRPPIMDGQETTREQIAGRIYGIDFIIKLMEDILRRGDKALRDLQSQGVQINTSL